MSWVIRAVTSAVLNPIGWVAACAVVLSSCGSTSTESVVGPGGAKCAVTLTGPDGPVSAAGAEGAVVVSTQPECEWSATAEASWITSLSPTSGQGNGQVQFRAVANPTGTTRESAINVNGQRATIRQSAAACDVTATASTTSFSASGGGGTITIGVATGCPWTATSDVGWITLSPSSGSGSATVALSVSANAGAARTGTVTVGSLVITIVQAAVAGAPPSAPCTVTLQQSSTSLAAAGGSGSIGIVTSPGCAWTANSAVPWITLAVTAGNGSGSVAFTVAPNTATSARTGTVNVSGAVFTVNQAGTTAACAYSINPTSQSVGAAGGAGTAIAVSTTSSCSWTASSNASWLTITSAPGGSGNGTVNFTVAANTGAARTGTLTVAGLTFSVNQAAAAPTCSYSINPTSITVGSDDSPDLTVAVTAGSGCAWTASASASWLDIRSGQSGTGNGTVTYRVDGFNGTSRTGTMTIGGQTFTVTQVACSATLNPQTQAVTAVGGVFTVSVTTQIGCQWQAVESLNWVSVTNGNNRIGSGTLTYTVLSNAGGARTGTIAIAGVTLTINQAAVLK